GSQYTSDKLRKRLKKLRITQSMSAKGNCYDNAACESFFSTFKRELLPTCGYFESPFHAQAAVFEHIEGFYNTRRKHSSLGMKSPIEYLKINRAAIAA
ncbi:MAG: integrase core domain-containing protein, partial [Verrucomicrobiota bacterium]